MAAITTAALGLGLSGYQAFQGAKQKKQAANEINSYQRQDISPDANPYRKMQLSTVGSDLANEQNQLNTTNAVDVLQGGGIRGVLGGLPQIVAASNKVTSQIQADLDKQFIDRQSSIAQGEANLMNMREARDMQNIGALSSQFNAGQQDMWSGFSGMASGLTSIGKTVGGTNDGTGTRVKTVTTNPDGGKTKVITKTGL